MARSRRGQHVVLGSGSHRVRPGFAGVDNELYYNQKCRMLFGEARDSLNKLLAAMR